MITFIFTLFWMQTYSWGDKVIQFNNMSFDIQFRRHNFHGWTQNHDRHVSFLPFSGKRVERVSHSGVNLFVPNISLSNHSNNEPNIVVRIIITEVNYTPFLIFNQAWQLVCLGNSFLAFFVTVLNIHVGTYQHFFWLSSALIDRSWWREGHKGGDAASGSTFKSISGFIRLSSSELFLEGFADSDSPTESASLGSRCLKESHCVNNNGLGPTTMGK